MNWLSNLLNLSSARICETYFGVFGGKSGKRFVTVEGRHDCPLLPVSYVIISVVSNDPFDTVHHVIHKLEENRIIREQVIVRKEVSGRKCGVRYPLVYSFIHRGFPFLSLLDVEYFH